ncbi:MAG: hypothetical protein ACREKH_15610 [Candidatus Rokuibacteriota bacterium]
MSEQRELARILGADQREAWAERERAEAEWRWERRNQRRIRRAHGAEGLRLIAALVDRVLARHRMPVRDAWAWAEAKYERGEVLC